jgi:ABC-2 type transport system ATP-binding protein
MMLPGRRAVMTDISISVKGLRKTYRETVAVDRISFEASGGEILGILGPNGSGKTTTLKSILGLIRFDEGSIDVLGLDVSRRRKKSLEHVGAVLEGARNIYWYLSPEENLLYFAGIRGFSRREAARRSGPLLEELGLSEVSAKEVRELSSGMKQKVSLACAFVHDPDVLLLDEPTLGLDVETSISVRNWLRALAASRGKTILVTSHDLGFVESVCDRILIIKSGRIVSHESVESLKAKFSRKFYEIGIRGEIHRTLLEKLSAFCEVEEHPDGENRKLIIALRDPMQMFEVIEALRSENAAIRDFRTVESDLAEIFLRVIEREG